MASTIQDNFQKRLKRKNRGVKQAGFVVLHQTFMPSILIELGFLTNKTEGRYLNSKKGQQEMASAISVAVKKYFSTLKANTVLEKEKTEVVVKKDTINVKPKEKTDIDESVIFKVQIASSKRKIRTKSYNFKGLKNIERVKIGKFYKYYYGISNNYQQTKQSLILAKNKGYNSAFIAAFKDGKKVSLTEILK